jgi:tetratricopeptide (TPR) repeat protein
MLLTSVAPQLGLGYAYNLLGRFLESIPLLEQARDLANAGGSFSIAARILTHLGEAYGVAGRMEEGTVALQRARDLARQRGMGAFEAWALYVLGNVYALRDPADALSLRQNQSDAVALAHELEMRPLQAQCHLAIGELAQKPGQQAEAREQLTKAAEMLTRHGHAVLAGEGRIHAQGALAPRPQPAHDFDTRSNDSSGTCPSRKLVDTDSLDLLGGHRSYKPH